MSRFLQWLFPALYSPWVTCAQCGCKLARRQATRHGMRHFCPRPCEEEYTDANQW